MGKNGLYVLFTSPTQSVEDADGTEFGRQDLHKLKSQGVDINDMKKKLKRHGDSALERLLEQMDVDKALLAIELRIMANSCRQSLPTSFNTHQPPSLV